MLEELTADSVYAAIIMQEPQPRAVLLVEGSDDDMMLGDHLRRGAIGIVCGSRGVVVEAVVIAQGQGRHDVFGLVDRDVVREVTGGESLPDAVVTTSAYDLTADVAAAHPGAIRMAVLAHAFKEARIVADARGHDVEHAIIEVASTFAGIRIAVQRARYPVRLDGFDFTKVIGRQFETLSVEAFAAHLTVTKPDTFNWSETSLEELRASTRATIGVRALCGGHDIAGVAYGLVTVAGARNFSRRSFEAAIRVHATCELLAHLACIVELQQLCVSATGAQMFDCVALAA